MTTFVHEGRRSSVVLLAVLAMIAALFALPATPVHAATAACPDTIPSAGFTDLGGYSAEVVDAADCLAFYGITKGTSATTYGPALNVNRWQMALFLTRQAEDHGVTLPSGADQGFTDLTGLSAEAVTAVNQLKQLNITQGTSATTFDPFGNVSRWQMALFITRLVSAAGITLPSGADQGFTDLTGLSAEAVTAVNQLAQLNISKGTSATTFDPNGLVTRAQMALFLTRTLDAGGVTPPGLAQVVVTPSTETSLPDQAARAYTASFFNADGSIYTGRVGIWLMDADADGDIDWDTTANAVDAELETVEGVAEGDQDWTGFAGTDGKVSFIVRDCCAGATDAIPLAWIDSDGDNTPETTTTAAGTEPYALGGLVKFSSPAPEPPDGTYNGVVVDSANAAGDDFVGDFDFPAGAPVEQWTFSYDSNDIFQVKGVLSDLAGFEAALSKTDVVDVQYFDTASDVSTFNITTDNTAATSLKVTDPSKAVEIDSNNYLIVGTGEAGYTVAVYNDADNDAAYDTGEAKLAEGTIAAGGSWSLSVPLQQNADNNFVAIQRKNASDAVADGTAGTDVPTISEGTAFAPILEGAALTLNAGGAGVDPGDVWTLDFDELMKAPAAGDVVTFFDGDGTTATVTCSTTAGVGQATCAFGATDDIIVVTINLFPTITAAGGTAGVQYPAQVSGLTGFTDTTDNAVDLASSTDLLIN